IALLNGEQAGVQITPERVLLVLSYQPDLEALAREPAGSDAEQDSYLELASLNIEPLQTFERSHIHNERYYLYWLSLTTQSS
ncbi:MAG: hypothetical protein AAGF24_11655, partial [Cyanobacteria bacterium P01_H01_bin.121]